MAAMAQLRQLAFASLLFYKARGIIIVSSVKIGDTTTALQSLTEPLPALPEDSRYASLVLSKAKFRSHATVQTQFFRKQVVAQSIREGVLCLLQTAGLGKMDPNTVFLDLPKDPVLVEEFVTVLSDLHTTNFNICLFNNVNALLSNAPVDSTIDLYWLRDDGGLTLMITSLLHRHHTLEKCKVRLLVPHYPGNSEQLEQKEVHDLLKLLRINVHVQLIAADELPQGQTSSGLVLVRPLFSPTMVQTIVATSQNAHLVLLPLMEQLPGESALDYHRVLANLLQHLPSTILVHSIGSKCLTGVL